MSSANAGNRKTRSSTIFQEENEALKKPTAIESVPKLSDDLLGVPLVDFDSPEAQTFVVIARRFGKQIVYRFNKQKSLYLFSARSALRQFVIFLTTNQYFEFVILMLIITNCILLAFKDQPEEVEYVFAALYTMEMILKIIAKGFCLHKFAYLRDPWNWLDFVVVILGYLTMAPSIANFSGIRTFRVLRALRTISVIEGLRTMVNAFLRSMRMLTDVLVLSLFFISIFALVGMQLFVGVLKNKCVLTPGLKLTDFGGFVANESNWLYFNGDPVVCGNGSTARSCPANYTCFPDVGDNPNHGYTNFDSFPWALLVTIQLVTADYWENVYEYIIASNGIWAVFYFLIVIFFGSFYILNLILAVVALSYQQELAKLNNQEAGYNQLRTTSSSYSLHLSFQPQKLFPTKPTTSSNWSSLLRRYTKTSPYAGDPNGSLGPYYPSSPDHGTVAVQSPLTLDKVTPFPFDNESVASFYNYEPEVVGGINGIVCSSDRKRASCSYEVYRAEIIKPKVDGTEMLKSPSKLEKNQEKGDSRSYVINSVAEKRESCLTELNIAPCDGKEDMNHFPENRGKTLLQQETGTGGCDKIKTENSGFPEVPERFGENAEQKNTERNITVDVRENQADKMKKIPYEKLTLKRNQSSANTDEKGTMNNLKKNPTQRDNGDTHGNSVTNLVATETCGEFETESSGANSRVSSVTQHRTDKAEEIQTQQCNHDTDIEAENSHMNNDIQSKLNSNSALNWTTSIPEITKGSLQAPPKLTSPVTPTAWQDACTNPPSVDKRLILIQTSSVCVFISRDTDPGGFRTPVNVLRRKCAALIMNPMFDWLITSIIFLNTVVMAMEYHGMNKKFENTLDNINLACTFVFITEMFVKVTALTLRGYVQSRWNILDGFIVVISVVEMTLVWCVPDVTHGLGFSVLRSFRLVRILKLAQSWVTMRNLLSTIGASIGQLGHLTLLLAIVTYTFAVIGMQLFSESFTAEHFEDKEVPRWNFGDFLHSFMIIFRVLCGEWIEPLVMTMHVTTPKAIVFYLAVLIIGNFLILNLFLALLLNSFSTESLNDTRAKQSMNIRERFSRAVRKYLDVMRWIRAPRLFDKTRAAQNDRECEKENVDGPRANSSRPCETERQGHGTEKTDSVIANINCTLQSSSKTPSRDTCVTSSKHSQKTTCHYDEVVPDCLPISFCKCLHKKKEHQSILYKVVAFCRAKVLEIVEHRYFDAFILFIIFISSVSLALEDVHLDSKPDLKAFLKILNYVVIVIFALEFLLKLFGFGLVQYFRNPWNCLDFFIVVVSIVSLLGTFGDGNLTAFRSLRTLRALRPLRAIPRWQGMKVVVNSLLSAIPEIGNVSLVCLIFWLIFSVMGVHFFGGRFYKCLDENGEALPHTTVANKTSCLAMNYTWRNSDIHFDNSLSGFLALFQVATFEGWMEIMADAADATEVDKQPERDKNHVSHLFFVVFVLFGSFFVLNLFVGVIIDNFNRLKKEYESGAVGLFLTESQRAWYDTLKKAASKKPRKVARRPKAKWRAYLFDIVNSSKFEFAIMILIILNMMIMMVSHHGQTETVTNILAVIFLRSILFSNLVFTVIFCLEAALRLWVQRLDYFKEPWNVFDFIVVLLSVAGFVMEYLNHAFIITPSIFRVIRVFRVGRLLRFYKNARGIRRLLFALLISLPALVNIGALLFLLLFIYAIIGMSSFAYVKHSGAINDMVNFETFRNSMLLLFRLSTSAGWNDVLAPLMVTPPDCDPTYDDLPNGNCGNPYFAIFYFVSFVLITSLIVINMYIAVILENLHEAFKAEATGITFDDLDMFYSKWEQYDPHATQYIPHGLLSDFMDSLEQPLRLPKPNKFACINLHIPIQQGDRIHCVDVLQALVRQLMGDIEQENPEAFVLMQKKLEDAFLAAFPKRAEQRRETTTFARNREIYAASIIQKAWRVKSLKNKTSQQAVYTCPSL